MYLTASRPDIAFAIGMCARYQADPKTSHLAQATRILRCISGTYNLGLLILLRHLLCSSRIL